MILTFSGASGVGKTTLEKELGKRSTRCWLIPSVTTRPERPGEIEINGSQEYRHLFWPDLEFRVMANAGQFIKVYEYHGYLYGTETWRIKQGLKNKDEIYMAALSLPGPRQWHELASKVIKEEGRWVAYEGGIHSVYLDLSDEEERRRRLHERGETRHERFRDELAPLREEAKSLGVDFFYLDAKDPPAVLADQVIEHFKLTI